jgi:hypothetical protein
MGLFARACSLRRPGPMRDGGLLHRSLSLLQKLSPEPATVPEPQAPAATEAEATTVGADELLYRVSQVREGIPAPALLFCLLKEHLRLKAAALLLHDAARQLFVPWCSTGLDTTTRHRLLLPPGFNAPFNRAAAGEVTRVDGEELEGFRELFSSREFAQIRRIVLAPFVHGGRLLGLLLIARLASEPSGEILSLLQQLTQQASHLFRWVAGRPVEEAQQDSGLPLPELVATMLQAAKQKAHPLILMRLELSALLRQATARYPELEPFRLQEEVFALCRAMFRVIGQVRNLKPRRLLVLVNGMKDADPELLCRQVESVVQTSLRELIEPGAVDLGAESRIIQDDPEPALRFLAEAG